MKTISREIAKFSQNLINSAVDLVLFKIYLGTDWKAVGESQKKGPVGEWQGLEAAWTPLPALTPTKIARALKFLLKQGYIELSPSGAYLSPQITETGGKRLDSIFPVYEKERPWDGKFYLINYDVPVGKNTKRDALRLFLKSTGCVLLQSSVWLTPHNPTKELSKFLKQRGLLDAVIVSVLLDAPLLASAYRLKEINERYQRFLAGWGGEGVAEIDRMKLAFGYFAILKDDPQLPFELLPKDWAGERAQELFEKLFFGK